ncbi:MAG: sensor histidine kinase, partial [Burkholderiaceae bacterium]
VEGQADALRILINNLIDNAIRYTPSGGSVAASTRAAGNAIDEVTLEVADSGPGVAADQRERVFERFYRGTVAAGDGSGLGLAIARRIVEMHGGHIELGENPGGGLLVRVRFPPTASPEDV